MSIEPRETKYRLLFPAFGAILFCILYIAAAVRYPGGSQLNPESTGFSWTENYWCQLLNETAYNGQPNKAQTIAMIAMLVLSITLSYFWYFFPQETGFFSPLSKRLIQFSGIASMLTGLFMSGESHDIVINIATLLGLVAIGGTFAGLYKLKWFPLLWLGIFNIILIGLNNLLYYNESWRYYLPVVQKITFFSFLLWISLISLGLFKRSNKKTGNGNP